MTELTAFRQQTDQYLPRAIEERWEKTIGAMIAAERKAADGEISKLRADATRAAAELRHAYRERETRIDPALVARAIEILELATLDQAPPKGDSDGT